MKIFILSCGRSGSSSLQNALEGGNLKYKALYEPFREPIMTSNGKTKDFYVDPDDTTAMDEFLKFKESVSKSETIIEKSLAHDPLKYFPNKSVDFFMKYFENFDKIILLLRRDLNACAESFAFAEKTGHWHGYYKINSKEIDKNILENAFDLVKKSNRIINELSTKMKIPIFYYEDIFFNKQKAFDVLDYCSLKLSDDHLEVFNLFTDSKLKYRK